jgi:hypothetical protein
VKDPKRYEAVDNGGPLFKRENPLKDAPRPAPPAPPEVVGGFELKRGHAVVLTPDLMAMADAESWRVLDLYRDRPPPDNFKDTPEARKEFIRIEGTRAEVAVAWAIGGTWTGGAKKVGLVDVTGPDPELVKYEVRRSRTNARYPYGNLCIHHDDKHELVAVHVTGQDGSYVIHGCYPVGEAHTEHNPEWRNEYPEGNLWVPHDELRPLPIKLRSLTPLTT